MNWVKLKIVGLPFVAAQVEEVEAQYRAMLGSIRKGEIGVVQQLVSFQKEIRNRIDQLDDFQNRNFSQEKIDFFQLLKLRLRRLLSPEEEINRMISQEQYQTNVSDCKKLEFSDQKGKPKPASTPTPAPTRPRSPKQKGTDLVFTIKMPREDYEQYLRERRR